MSCFGCTNSWDFGEMWIKTAGGWRPAYLCSKTGDSEAAATNNADRKAAKRDDSRPESNVPSKRKRNSLSVSPTVGQPVFSKERRDQACLSEALSKLNMVEVVRDTRMFTYVIEVVELLTCHLYAGLSGSAQNQLLAIAKAGLEYVLYYDNHVHLMDSLLSHLQCALLKTMTSHTASPRFTKALNEVEDALYPICVWEPRERKDDSKALLTDLPDELISKIVGMLSNPLDIENTSKTCQKLQRVSVDWKIWKRLTYFHFNESVVNSLVSAQADGLENWKDTFYKINKNKKLHQKAVYGCVLQQCDCCRGVFWETLGHVCTCTKADVGQEFQDISPQQFVELFSAQLSLDSRKRNPKKLGYTYGM